MADWNHTVILHEPRKLLGITVLEYTVLDVIYKSQTSPIYSVNGWSKNGCHQLAKFMGCSPATVLAILERMEVLGYLVLNEADKQLKKTTEAFYSVAYEKDKDSLLSKQGCSKTERVRKLNAHRSETERDGVRKLNGKCSETEHKDNLIQSESNSNVKNVELHSTVTLIDEIDETSVEIHHIPDYFDTEQKKPKEKSGAKKEKVTTAAPTRAMFQYYEQKYAELNAGNKPIWLDKYAPALKKLHDILTARCAQKGIIQLDPLQPWKDFVDMWALYLNSHPKEVWHRDNFNPMTMYSQFNGIIAKLNAQPVKVQSERMDKWEKWGRENGVM